MSTYISLLLSSICAYIYVYIVVHIHMYIYIYIYIAGLVVAPQRRLADPPQLAPGEVIEQLLSVTIL